MEAYIKGKFLTGKVVVAVCRTLGLCLTQLSRKLFRSYCILSTMCYPQNLHANGTSNDNGAGKKVNTLIPTHITDTLISNFSRLRKH